MITFPSPISNTSTCSLNWACTRMGHMNNTIKLTVNFFHTGYHLTGSIPQIHPVYVEPTPANLHWLQWLQPSVHRRMGRPGTSSVFALPFQGPCDKHPSCGRIGTLSVTRIAADVF